MFNTLSEQAQLVPRSGQVTGLRVVVVVVVVVVVCDGGVVGGAGVGKIIRHESTQTRRIERIIVLIILLP